MNNGYVFMYRTLMDKGYYKDSHYVHLWLHLIFKATYRDKEYLFNGKIEYLEPGQFIAGRKSLSKETGIQESKIERILNCFKNEHQIEQQKNNKFRIISITNWDKYQINEQQNEQEMNNQRTTSEQPVNTNNTVNTVKKENNKESIVIPYQELISLYHEILPELPKVAKLTDKRKAQLKARWYESEKTQSLDWWKDFFETVKDRPFLLGQNDRGWQADIDFLTTQSKFIKIIEGKYK